VPKRFKHYKLNSPCPACGGYNGASRKEKRCKGYFDAEREEYYCQHVESATEKNPFGVPLYLVGNVVGSEASAERSSDIASPTSPPPTKGFDLRSPPTEQYNETYSQNIPEEEKVNTGLTKPEGLAPAGLVIEKIEVRDEPWFRVVRDGVEVTRVKRDQLPLLRGWVIELKERYDGT